MSLVVTALIISASMGYSQELTRPESVGLSSKHLAHIDHVIKRYMDGKTIPGAVVLVARHGKIAYFKAFGKADEGKPMTKEAIFAVASMSKTITAAAVMQLVDQGRILLTDPVSMYIPEFKKQKVATTDKNGKITLVPAEREITIHDLLSMTSGMTSSWSGGKAVIDFVAKLYMQAGVKDGMDNYAGTLGESVKIVARLPLVFQPGKGWEYSNAGVDTLGYLVEVVSGMALDAYLGENLFQPLKMGDTAFYPPESKRAKIPAVYYGHGEKKGQKMVSTKLGPLAYATFSTALPFGKHKTFFIPSGGIHATAYDWFRFAQMFLNKGRLDENRVLSRQAVTLMTTNQIGDLPNTFWDNRWGYMIDIQEDNAVDMPFDFHYGGQGAFGWTGIYGTRWLVHPAEDTVIVFMSHTWFFWDVNPVMMRVAHVVNRAIME